MNEFVSISEVLQSRKGKISFNSIKRLEKIEINYTEKFLLSLFDTLIVESVC